MFWVLFLLAAWAGGLLSCGRLLLAAARAAEPATGSAAAYHHDELSLYETAYLAGGPHRVADLTLLSMQHQRRLLLAHTGWATVLDPVGRDPHERSLLGAFGPDGQSPVPAVRSAVVRDEAVRALADRLGAAGLAPTAGVRGGIGRGVRAVRGAALLILVLAAASLCVPAEGTTTPLLLAWFALPLTLTLACLAIARFEAGLHSSWASPAGQRLLVALDRELGGAEPLAAVAVHGAGAVDDPVLRAALGYGSRGRIPRQRGY
uniref:TIGR04222 domain-containing membrane protein n=1 Tax=Streptomyces sp. NBC_00049 TaxID=2903617 RepID=A0AAU2JZ23_9ACTN